MRPSPLPLLGLLIGLAAPASGAPAGGPPVRLYVLAGQSNAVGTKCDAALLPPELQAPQHDVLFLYDEGAFLALQFPPLQIDSGGRFGPLQYQTDLTGLTFGGVMSGFGPEIQLGRVLADAHADQVALIKFAFSATGLEDHWAPGLQPGLYGELVATIQAAGATLSAQGFEPHLEGFVWMQGESDADDVAEALDYAGNLAAFLSSLRADLHAPGLRFAVGLLSPKLDGTAFPYTPIVRNAQVSVAAALPGVEVVETADLPIQPDAIHFTGGAQLVLGHRFASALVGAMPYGAEAAPANSIALGWDGSAVLGQTFLAVSTSVPGPTCLLAASLAPDSLPLLGGKLLLQPGLLLGPVQAAPAAGGKAVHALALPLVAGLADLHVYLQTFGSTASQPTSLAFSNGLDLRLSP